MFNKLVSKYQRTASRYFARRICRMKNEVPLISFTFDDFPRSALTVAGKILQEHGWRGTYYASFGLMNSNAPTGEIFGEPDIELLLANKHELGCHTFAHCHAYETAPAKFEASLRENARALQQFAPGARFKTHSYPISGPNPGTKRRVASYFEACRGGGQTHNRHWIDLNFVSAFFLEQSRDDFANVQRAIDVACAEKCWLVFATHDVCNQPTRFGCTPEFFMKVASYASASGARVLPVAEALEFVHGRS